MKRIALTTRKAKTFLALLLSWTMAASAWAEDQCSLFVLMKDGTNVRFVLPVQKPVVRCTHGMMQIDYLSTNQGETYMAFERDQVENLTVGTEEPLPNGIVSTDGVQRIQFDLTSQDVVRVCGLQKGDLVQVFGLDGKAVSVPVSRHDGEAVVDLSQQRRGVYMVSVNQRFTFKLMKP